MSEPVGVTAGRAVRRSVKRLRPSVGKQQLSSVVSIDYERIEASSWVLTMLTGERFGLQVHEYPLDLARPYGLVVWFVDADGKYIPTGGDVQMSIVSGPNVAAMLGQYIGVGDITVVEHKNVPGVSIVHAPLNEAMRYDERDGT